MRSQYPGGQGVDEPAPDETTARPAAAPPEPLGPDSLTWKYFGGWRGMLFGPWAGSMQNMHPGLGAGVEEHSEFFDERWERLYRSLYPIYGVVFDGPRAPETAAQVRGYHNTIKGVDKKGRKYNALDPGTFYWAHSTFFYSLMVSIEWFDGPLTLEEKHRLFDEHVQWYRLYGMPMHSVPESWEAFLEYWDHMCRNVLEDNKATRDVLDLSNLDRPPFLRWFPEPGKRCVRRSSPGSPGSPSASTTPRYATCSGIAGVLATRRSTPSWAARSVWAARSCRSVSAITRAPERASIAPQGSK